jgi:hypothetical protein
MSDRAGTSSGKRVSFQESKSGSLKWPKPKPSDYVIGNKVFKKEIKSIRDFLQSTYHVKEEIERSRSPQSKNSKTIPGGGRTSPRTKLSIASQRSRSPPQYSPSRDGNTHKPSKIDLTSPRGSINYNLLSPRLSKKID